MKKIVFLLLFWAAMGMVMAQTSDSKFHDHETYIEMNLSKAQLQQLSPTYYIDKVVPNDDGSLHVQICLAQKQYNDFLTLNLPFSIMQSQHKAYVNMAESYEEMTLNWKRYPTYSTYTAMMDTFQTQFPNICKIDTILAETPGGHSILVAHISQNLNERGDKPAFFYTSTMHGDEPVGYYFMLRLIHYLLNNYATNAEVQNIVNNIDLWICPIENPDGTYYSGDDVLDEWPTSMRTNYYEEDLNRSYPQPGEDIVTKSSTTIPEADAMIAFGQEHHLTMSVNFHGGVEVYNYPWDLWSSEENAPADQDWWELVGHAFADTCHLYNESYMTYMNNGVTEGGDWYAAPGSRQDCFNYHLGCREACIEVSDYKVVSSYMLPKYWGYIQRSLLNYMQESLNGLRGIVTDSQTGNPIEATVFIENHDKDNSHTQTIMPTGNYHRPLKAGTYSVTFSSPGYYPQTLDVTVFDHQSVRKDVALVPYGSSITENSKYNFKLSPNPTSGIIYLEMLNEVSDDLTIEICNMTGVPVQTQKASGRNTLIDIQRLPAGIYVVKVMKYNNTVHTEKIVKK